VAWFSAIVDDCYIWDGEPGCWKDTRWTGVVEKRDGAGRSSRCTSPSPPTPHRRI